MRVVAGTFALVVSVVALLACGGQSAVDYVPLDHTVRGSDGGGSSGSTASSGGSSGSRASSSDGGGASGSSSGAGEGGSGSSSALATCPPAAAIKGNGACDLDPNVMCPSDITYAGCDGNVAGTLACYCFDGTWECPEPTNTPCTFEGGAGCPLPASIQSGMPCDLPGATCPGDPRECNGQPEYDAYQCSYGTWTNVAHTVCDADGG